MNHLEAIKAYLAANLSPVPIKIKDKYPSMLREWRSYMKRQPTEQEMSLWSVYRNSQEYGCGLICGAVSGNLEVIDFDNHTGNAERYFNEFSSIPEVRQIITANDLAVETTQSGGYHLLYRSEKIDSSKKLFTIKDLIGDRETYFKDNLKFAKYIGKDFIVKRDDLGREYCDITEIETRGEGGLIVTAPTKGYEVVAGDLRNIPTISAEERNTLIDFARAFNVPDIAPAPAPRATTTAATPSDDQRPGDFYNENCAGDIPAILTAAGWQHLGGKNWRRPGKKDGVSATLGHVAPDTFYCFTSNGHPFEENHAYKPFTIFALLEHGGDFSAAARDLVARYPSELGKPGGGGKPGASSPSESIPEIVKEVIDRGIFNIKRIEPLQDENIIDFYHIGDKGGLKIEWANMRRFLTRHGFFRYRSGNKYEFVRVVHNVADFVTLEDIQNYVLTFLLANDREEAHNKLWDTDKLNEKKLQLLDECEPLFVRDPEDYSYVFFKNTAVYVSKYEKKTVPYKDLPGFVWKKQIIDRDYNDLKEDVIDNCDFAEFCKRISAEKDDRMGALMGALGYLMHTYKDPAFPPVINFTDEANSDSGPAGGSGKGMIFQAVARIRNVVFVDGKNFDPKNQFALQRVSEDTDIIFFQDLDKRFDFEAFFSMVTDGMTIQKKYQGERFIGYKETPKIGLNANYQIKGDGESFERRLFDIEVHKYFNQQRTIIAEFGHRFFEDGWDAAEWNKFDNYMMYCIQYYLRNGLQRPKYVFVEINKLSSNTSAEFAEWAVNLVPNKRYNKAALYERFRNESGDDTTKQRYFTRYLKAYAKHKGWEITDRLGSGGTDIEFIGVPDEGVEPADALPF